MRRLFKILVFVVAGNVLWAEPNTDPIPDFRFISLEGSYDDLQLVIGSKTSELLLPENSFSRPFLVPSKGSIKINKKVTYVEDGVEKTDLIEVADIDGFPKDEKLLIFLNPVRMDDQLHQFRYLVIPSSYESFPAETLRLFNFSSFRLAAQVTDTFKEAPMRDFVDFDFPAGNRMCVFKLAYESGSGEWNHAFTTRQPSRKNLRCVAIVRDNEVLKKEGIMPISAVFLLDPVMLKVEN